MASMQFRTAFRGFNREDVVHYIEYLNNQHNAVVEQLNNQLQNTPKAGSANEELQAQLTAALERCAQLEAQLAAMPAAISTTEEELEAYRRAERAERMAKTRVSQMYAQANAAIADTAANLDAAAADLGKVAQEAMEKIQALQTAVTSSKQVITNAAVALGAIRPGTEEE